jgi:hypothetical protein
MKPALVIITEPKGQISKMKYLAGCMQHVLKEGYFPISKEAFEGYAEMKNVRFLEEMKEMCSRFYCFTDFGVSTFMTKAIDTASSVNIPVVYVTLSPDFDKLKIELSEILEEVSQKSRIPVDVLKSPCKKRELADARFMYYKRAKEILGSSVSYASIGVEVGKNHATVLNGIKRVEEVKELRDMYEEYYSK